MGGGKCGGGVNDGGNGNNKNNKNGMVMSTGSAPSWTGAFGIVRGDRKQFWGRVRGVLFNSAVISDDAQLPSSYAN